jgi:deazaflavin-dependent oxidoreductase (nitroreductase family)
MKPCRGAGQRIATEETAGELAVVLSIDRGALTSAKHGSRLVRKLWAVSLTGALLRLHQKLYVRSDGRVGHRMIGVPTLLLRTTGRRSGATRTNALVYARDGDDYLVVASNGGADQPPAWLYNLRAKPEVEIQVGKERRTASARIIEPADPHYERLWRIVNDNNRDRYSAYQQQTSRPIPVIAVAPS